MSKIKLRQKQMSALGDRVIDETVIGKFKTISDATDYLKKRGFKHNSKLDAWVQGDNLHYPVFLEDPGIDMFDIRHFI